MTKQKMTSMSSTMSKRKSIGLANLVDAAPLSPTRRRSTDSKKSQRMWRRKSKPRREFVAREEDDHDLSPSPTAVSAVPDAATTPVAKISGSGDGEQVREAEFASSATSKTPYLEPTTPRGSPAAAARLFDATANDEFFEVIASEGMELCGSEDEAQRIRLNTGTTAVEAARTPVNVNGFKDSTHGKTLLHQACKSADLQVIKCLLYHGASAMQQCVMGRSPFHDVISSTRRERALIVMQTLYEYEPQGITLVDINGTHVVHLAAIHGCLDVIQWCASLAARPTPLLVMSITSFSGRNVLHYAAYNGRLKVLEWLLQDETSGAPSITSLDVNGYSVLHYAAMGGHLSVCQWLIFRSPTRRDINIVATNTDKNTALDLARQPELQAFLEEVSQLPSPPTEVECIGVDSCSMGISWKVEPATDDPFLLEVLAPKWFELEYCKKPTGLRRASAMLSMLMIMPSSAASAATVSASSYLLTWENLSVLIQPDAQEYWLSGLDSDCEYLVRMRTYNRNGYSEYSIPSLSGEFKTCASGGNQPKRNSLRHLFTAFPTRGLVEMSFIGTLDLELLEARRLLYCTAPSAHSQQSSRHNAASQGQFFAVVTLQVPLEPLHGTATRRRTSLSLFTSDPDTTQPPVHSSTSRMRCLYRLRTDFGSVHHELLTAGTLHAFRHSRFGLRTKLRVPEALDSELIVEVHHETPSAESSVVGVARIPLMNFVRGFPAKLQWVGLEHGISQSSSTSCSRPHGELLLRSLFLADGITALPHPTKDFLECNTAEELLDDGEDLPSMGMPTSSASDSATTASSSSPESASPTSSPTKSPAVSPTSASRVSIDLTGNVKYDALGFFIFPTRAGDARTLRTYEYHRLHHQCMALQQEALWMRFHGDVAIGVKEASPTASSLSELLHTDQRAASYYNPSASRNSTRLRHLAWDGIPSSSRRVLYMHMSGAEAKRQDAASGYYQQQLKRVEHQHCPPGFETTRKQIQVDLQRTFAGNQSWINSGEGQAAMERVLLAYAIHNERIGYCQSMSFIVGRLLCLFNQHSSLDEDSAVRIEEDAFWLLAVLCEDFFPTYYTKGMEGLHVDGLVLEALLQRRLPKVARHFQVVLQNSSQLGLLLVTGWLLPVFCAVFPSETSFRLLDVLFYERSNVVFALLIALLRMTQTQLLNETRDYMQLFRLLKQRDQRLHDATLLLEVALDEHLLLENEIDTLRQECKAQFHDGRKKN